MDTHILIGNPQNLYVFNHSNGSTGSAPFAGDPGPIVEHWEPVLRETRVGSSRGTLFRRPENERAFRIITPEPAQ